MPPEPADLDYTRVMSRVARLMGALALAGTLVWFVARGWQAAASFAAGAAVSALSLWLLHRVVSDVTAVGEGRQVQGRTLRPARLPAAHPGRRRLCYCWDLRVR